MPVLMLILFENQVLDQVIPQSAMAVLAMISFSLLNGTLGPRRVSIALMEFTASVNASVTMLSTSLESQFPSLPAGGESKRELAVRAEAEFDPNRACSPKTEQRKSGLIPKNFMMG